MMAASVPWLDEAFPGRERGLAYGVQNLIYAVGYAIGPIVGGRLLAVGDAVSPTAWLLWRSPSARSGSRSGAADSPHDPRHQEVRGHDRAGALPALIPKQKSRAEAVGRSG